MKSNYWMYRFPGGPLPDHEKPWPFGTIHDVRFDVRVSERVVRQYLRTIWKFGRLPRGTEMWPSSAVV